MTKDRRVGASGDWARRLAAVESRNVTALGRSLPLFWTAAHGSTVKDAEGRSFLDLTSAFGPALGGHRHPAVEAAVIGQSRRLIHGMGDVHPPVIRVEFLERLMAKAPWADARGVLATSGSEAVEIALKTAQLATGRAGVLAFEGGYHGLTLGALSATARAHFRAPFEDRIYQGVQFEPLPTGDAAAAQKGLGEVQKRIEEAASGPGAIGAILVEPIQGRGGVRIPAPGFMQGLRNLADRTGTLLVLDEIFTGFGRTGRLFAAEHEEVVPDLMCVGKALGGGMPIGACLGPRGIMDAWPASDGEAIHTGTFLGHPLACAAGIAVLEALETERWVEQARTVGAALQTALRAALGGVRGVREVRGRGLMIGVELLSPEGGEWRGGGVLVAEEAIAEGLIVLPAGDYGEVIELAPSVVLTDEEIEVAVGGLTEAIRRASQRAEADPVTP